MLLLVGRGVGLDRLRRENGTSGVPAARVPHSRREVADDQHDQVPRLLELGKLCENHHMAEVDIGGARIDAQLHAQRRALGELSLQRPLGQDLVRPTPEDVEVSHARTGTNRRG
jgi:hypothetical protein